MDRKLARRNIVAGLVVGGVAILMFGLTFLAAFLCAGGSIAYLMKGKGDGLAVAAAEMTVLFGLCTLVSGPMWARKAWGAWWQWDVRLTTTLLLEIIFIAYLFARRYGGPGAKKLAAGLALFGAADVPLIYLSVSIWRTIHPKTTVVKSLPGSSCGCVVTSRSCGSPVGARRGPSSPGATHEFS